MLTMTMTAEIYGAVSDDPEHPHYSPAKCIGCDVKTISGVPDPAHVPRTSFVERQEQSTPGWHTAAEFFMVAPLASGLKSFTEPCP